MNSTAKDAGKLQVTTPSEREIAMTRVLESPMESGVAESYVKLAELLAST